MSRKRCIRKRWGAPVTAVAIAMAAAAVTPAAALDKLRINELLAIAAFAEGRAKPDDLHVACGMVNLTEFIARQGVGPEALEACTRAEAALRNAAARLRETGALELCAAGVAALRDVHEFHDLQRQSVPRAEFLRLIQGTMAALAQANPAEVAL